MEPLGSPLGTPAAILSCRLGKLTGTLLCGGVQQVELHGHGTFNCSMSRHEHGFRRTSTD